jgi:hypothetical protein
LTGYANLGNFAKRLFSQIPFILTHAPLLLDS